MNVTTFRASVIALAAALAPGLSFAEFAFEDDGKAVRILENGQPVLQYNYEMVAPPPEAEDIERYTRACYVHPLWGPKGDILTQDFPSDHWHHRGVFWGWPVIKVGERKGNNWELRGMRQHFVEWLEKDAGSGMARLGIRVHWKYDGEDEPVMEQRSYITVHPLNEQGRHIDFATTLENVIDEDVFLAGSQSSDRFLRVLKGYGGFNFRPDNTRRGRVITVEEGRLKRDRLSIDSAWVDWSSRKHDAREESGVTVIQHPDNPGYPWHGWIIRHYGFVGSSWPHAEGYTFAPGEAVSLAYRVYTHEGDAESAQAAEAAEAFAKDPFPMPGNETQQAAAEAP